ncbi:restriction endonuclease subunit S [Enterococcus faecalis]|uniref:restriction endonuclease subunit S n=5 Tax=Enterococcus faecalis TaxID=1351 RepID=UPI001D0B4AF7|nr:restriction endonuclease subunit S [Enterococcus faecalis]EHR4814542.1 restriction endonuclease subunit S [Enterococcus faecalis]MCB8471921.1 restriction endonuclease subunit S [Enterococcus faecalis]HED9420025.1 restriction endonuclease subunit S [Enterococcus faecalis]
MKKVPRLRFRGFQEDWELCKLIDLATTYIGLVTTMTTNYTDQGTLLIRNSDIKEGKFDLNNPIYLKEEFAKQNENRSMKMGDVVTVHTGDIGTSAVITEDLDGTIGFATITTRPSKKLNSNYLCWYFNSNIHKKYAKRMSTGDGRSNYNMKDFNKNILVIPKIEEQQTIGIFFQNLDNTITLHQRKLDQLKELKKAYLQTMFVSMNTKNNKVPKLRFTDFEGDWQLCKLSTEFEKVNERNDGSLGKEHWISVAKMYFQNPDKVQSNNIDTRTYVMRTGDIAFEGHPNKEFKFGRFVANDIGTGVVSELFPIYRHKQEYDNYYWKNAIQIERVMGPIFAKSITSSGNSSNKLDPNHFLRQQVLIPKLEEQKKIGLFLKKIDDIINLHQNKLTQLKSLKKSYLQNMFI